MRDDNPLAPPSWAGEPTASPPLATVEEPFTLPAQEIPRELFLARGPRRSVSPPKRRLKAPRSMAVALPVVIVLALISAFFSWVSVEPLWLAVGHGTPGTATVTRCAGDGMTRRCVGEFHTGSFAVTRISVLGLTDEMAVPGTTVAAEMVNERSHRAYAGGSFALRWLPGLILVLLCGLGIFLISGVRRFTTDRRERWAAFSISLACPFLITIGFLAAAF